MKINVVIKRNHYSQLGLASKPSNGISTNGQENEGHVELECLGGALSGGDTVPHDIEHRPILVLNELPGKEAGADGEPQGHDPNPSPIVLHKVGKLSVPPLYGVELFGRYELLAQQLAKDTTVCAWFEVA